MRFDVPQGIRQDRAASGDAGAACRCRHRFRGGHAPICFSVNDYCVRKNGSICKGGHAELLAQGNDIRKPSTSVLSRTSMMVGTFRHVDWSQRARVRLHLRLFFAILRLRLFGAKPHLDLIFNKTTSFPLNELLIPEIYIILMSC